MSSGAKLSKRGFRTRLERRHRANKRGAAINLVSMMDIFTILVFFLLVNSGDVQTLSAKSTLKLPDSVSDEKPKDNLVIVVDKKDILVQGRRVASLADIEKNDNGTIAPLRQELEYQSKRLLGGMNAAVGGSVTIMGDKEIPYRVLKKIMATCAQSNFGNISLAVQQRAESNL